MQNEKQESSLLVNLFGASKKPQLEDVGIESTRAQVVIIGAGLAGLAAAQRLHEAAIDSVIVLDALDRAGGRVHTIEHEDYLLELGAQWLHGADENPLYEWLTELEMLDDFESAALSFQGIFCTANGKRPIQGSLVERVLDILRQIKLALSKNNNYIDTNKDWSSRGATEVFKSQLEARIETDEKLSDNRQLVEAIFEWFLRYETIENCCDSMDQVSIASYTDWTDLGDGTLLNFKRGYGSLLAWFMDHFPVKSWLKLNKQVLKLELSNAELSNEKPILVHYKQTGCESVHYIECDHVIVTCSLGFLKQNYLTFFEPPLAKWRQELIESLGFGTVNKIVLNFERPFWSDCIKLVWLQDCDEQLPAWTRDIIAFDTVRRQPNLLIGWIGGEGARQMEQLSNEEVGQTCLQLLEKFLPQNHKRPTRLVECLCSRWNSNEFIRGSYSFNSMQSFRLNVDKLHEPIYTNKLRQRGDKQQQQGERALGELTRTPRVLFAGEATAGKLYSTTHGAIISGWREADRLKEHLLSNKQPAKVVSNGNSIGLSSSLVENRGDGCCQAAAAEAVKLSSFV